MNEILNIFEKDFEQMFQPYSKEEVIEKKLKECTVNPDGTFSCEGSIDLSNLGLKELPVKFKEVGGDFYCYNNRLTTLEGAPERVGGDFSCRNNQLTTLEGAPERVGRNFSCRNNQLTTLEGAPEHVGRDFYCSKNQLTTLEGAPEHVEGYFVCNANPVPANELKQTVQRDYL